MNSKINFMLLLITALLSYFCFTPKVIEENPMSIIPKPNKIKISNGEFLISNSTKIVVADNLPEVKKTANYLISKMKMLGYVPKVKSERESKNIILLQKVEDKKYGNEGYKLSVNENKIVITGDYAGLFYGVQTLLQLLPPEVYGNKKNNGNTWEIPFVEITDAPKFKWRGMHLDVGRHFFPVKDIKKYLDFLAMHKMNVFHWHLTEDQGWRIEIKKYPKLTQIGAFRKETIIGHPSKNTSQKFDGKRYGGFYTQDEIKDVVNYAADRFITVVPEIEMPGHSVAALAAYPELSCTGGPFEVRTSWGISKDIYCAGKEKTFHFLEDVLTEVLKLFPSEYIHIGGDEAPKDRWKNCSECQARIKEEKLKDVHELQSYFIQRIEKFLNSQGRKIIGWDEILEGGLAPNATVMSWRGNTGGIAAAKEQHNVVMTPTAFCYFDYYQIQNTKNEPLAIGGYLPLKKVYSFNPVPPEIKSEEEKYIIGGQGNVWTEYMPDFKQVEYMALPRMSAMAEVLWTESSNKNYNDFKERLIKQYKRFDAMEANYFNKPTN